MARNSRMGTTKVVRDGGATKTGVSAPDSAAEADSNAKPKAPRRRAATAPKAASATKATTSAPRRSGSAASQKKAQPADVASDPVAAASSTVSEPAAPAVSGATARRLTENVERIEALSHRLMSAFAERGSPNPGVEGPGSDLYLTAAGAWMKSLTEQPSRIVEQQVNFWGETLKNYANVQAALARGQLQMSPDEDANPRADRRFANPLWKSHPYFSFVKRQYEINANALKEAAKNLQLPDDVARRRIDWMTSQIVDMMSPTNFLATNPDALERAVATEGESLVKGLENLVRDVELHGGEMIVSLADRNAFTVGENIGASEGVVVHRTPLFELIQYRPTTDQAHETPLLIFPPWINKFYILDLKPENSLIRWLVGQGHTLFVVSWKNPDASYSDTGLEDYVAAYLEAMDRVRDLTDQPRLNVVGYCIAGTTLSLTLALLKQRGDDRVNSATFFTTLTDFSEQGEFVSFLQDDFVTGIGEEVARHGLMRAQLMSRTMSFLRANDLVWGPAIRSYMMGEQPPAFDLLYWNGDSTNLPGKMAMQYLRGLCQRNDFAGDGFDLMGHKLRLSDVTVPLCSVACESDHIAPWTDCWRGVAQMGSTDKTFILSESGHVAGIVNPPTRKKYGHYLGGSDYGQGFGGWRESAVFHPSSWWPSWGAWLAERAGPMVPSRSLPQDGEPAPGTYVHERAA